MRETLWRNAHLYRQYLRQRAVARALADIYTWLDGGKEIVLKDPKFLEEHYNFITKDFLKEFKISLRKFKKSESYFDEANKRSFYNLPNKNVRFFASLLPEERRQWYLRKK